MVSRDYRDILARLSRYSRETVAIYIAECDLTRPDLTRPDLTRPELSTCRLSPTPALSPVFSRG